MKKIELDTGVEVFDLGAGQLRFNPADPNVYARFSQVGEKLSAIEQELSQAPDADPVAALTQADRKLKALLGWVFGPDNDFDAITGGVSLLAVTAGGNTLAQSLLAALEPVLLAGAERYAQTLAESLLGGEGR